MGLRLGFDLRRRPQPLHEGALVRPAIVAQCDAPAPSGAAATAWDESLAAAEFVLA